MDKSGYTVDGVKVKDGLRVWTNNLDRGVIKTNLDYNEDIEEWFYVILDHDYRGAPCQGRTLQNGERVITVFQGEKA